MRLEILLSCMNLKDGRELAERSKIFSDLLIVNQCGSDDFAEYKSDSSNGGNIRIFSVNDKGLTKSRNFAIKHSNADVCLLCDDDETFKNGYEKKILSAWKQISDADVIIFGIGNRPSRLPDKVKRLGYFDLMKVSSWQISFKRKSIVENGLSFDENMGAGTPNGAEEEFKFLTDCRRKGLKIYSCPTVIADVAQEESTWFSGYDEKFFINRGNTTRYIMGLPLSLIYAFYYAFTKKKLFGESMSPTKAFTLICKGIFENRLKKIKIAQNEKE
jgi:glycosyltransferase involved in cell wall biosynthesis